MRELKVGNFKKSSNYEDIELTVPLNTDPATEPVVQPETVIQPETVVEPKKTVEPETVVTQLESETSSLKPNDSKPEPEVKFEIDDDKAFKYLSEKLGKEIKSIDDLKQPQVENPLDNDPYLKELYAWRKKTGRPIEDWIKYQKDYSKLSDLDVAREFLQHEYPTFTPSEIDAELNSFIANDLDDDDDINTKSRQLKKYSTKGRDTLQKLVSNLDSVAQTSLPPEVQQDLELAKQVKQDYAVNKQEAEKYNQSIVNVSKSIDSLKLSLSDDLHIDFKISDETKKTLPEMVTTMPHWKNQDGSWNHQSIVEDAIIIKHYKEMLKLAFEQGKNSGGEDIIKQVNNTTLGEPLPMGGQHTAKKGVEIEGFDNFIGKSKMKLRFNK